MPGSPPGGRRAETGQKQRSSPQVSDGSPTSPPIPRQMEDNPVPAHAAALSGDGAPARFNRASYYYVVNNEFSTSVLEPLPDDQNCGRSPQSGDGVVKCDEVQTKRMIEKEYVHIQDVSEAVKKKNDSVARVLEDSGSPSGERGGRSKKRTLSPFRWSRNKNTNNNVGNSAEPSSPRKEALLRGGGELGWPDGGAGGRKVRSTTLPSEMLTAGGSSGGSGSPSLAKKSTKKKSKSITSFFQVSFHCKNKNRSSLRFKCLFIGSDLFELCSHSSANSSDFSLVDVCSTESPRTLFGETHL